jgi:hypothetical protein
MVQRRRDSHIEGLATHDDPESCGHAREDVPEALTGAHAGRVLSRENECSQVPRLFLEPKATLTAPAWRGATDLARSTRDPEHAWKHHAREPGDPAHRSRRMALRTAVGSPRTEATDARGQGV